MRVNKLNLTFSQKIRNIERKNYKNSKMKKYISIFVIMLSFISLSAQNWQLISSNLKYNYQINDSGFITHQIFADSIEIDGFDTIFYLNRIVTVYDTSANTQYSIEFKIKNQPQFLMRQVRIDTNNVHTFQDTIEFMIKTDAHFGNLWTFNAEAEINAVISFEGTENVLEQTDSVKFISLSDGRTIKISKNYGIYYFEQETGDYYELIGIEGDTNIGEHLPDFWDVFDWEVGDIIQLKSGGSTYGDGYWYDELCKKYTILSKTITNDTLIFNVSGWVRSISIVDWYYVEYDTTAYLHSETLKFINKPEHLANLYPNQLTDFRNDAIVNTTIYPYEEMLDNVVCYKTVEGKYIKEIGDIEELFPYYTNYENDLLKRAWYNGPDNILLKRNLLLKSVDLQGFAADFF